MTIHAAESTAYSGLPRLIPAHVTDMDGFGDLLFEADDASTWRALLMRSGPNLSAGLRTLEEASGLLSSNTLETFLPTVLLAQHVVNIHMLREISKTVSEAVLPHRQISVFYVDILSLAKAHNIFDLEPLRGAISPQTQSLRALWHFTCAVRLAPISLVEEAAGRLGSPASESIAKVQEWVKTPAARLPTLHCGQILHQAADLKDLAFLLPRWVALLLPHVSR